MLKEKFNFLVGQDNLLALKLSSQAKPINLMGDFKVNERNNLVYYINKSSAWHRKIGLPDRIEFEGQWRLDKEHNLVLDLEKRRGKLVLKGEILDSRDDCLIFKINSKVSPSITRISILKLRGRWRADKFNRIVFEVSKRGKSDILTFKGAWYLNKNKQIVYKYERLKTKKKQTLIFKGYWEITSSRVITYILEKCGKSRFDFKAFLQTPNIYPARGKIKYRIGIGIRRERKQRIVVLEGKWHFTRKLGLSFEVDYGEKRRVLKFSVRVDLSKKDRIIFSLQDRNKMPLGISLTYRRKLLPQKDFEYFLRLRNEGKRFLPSAGGTIWF